MKDTKATTLFTLCNMAEQRRLTNSTIKSVMSSIWPRKKAISRQDIFYIRTKVKEMTPILRANPEYESFKEHANDSALLDGLDDELDIGDDLASELARDLWLEVHTLPFGLMAIGARHY